MCEFSVTVRTYGRRACDNVELGTRRRSGHCHKRSLQAMSASASLFIRSLDNKKRVHLISKRRQTTMFLFLIMVVLPSAPVSLNAHHGLPLCLHPQNATVRLFRRIFCPHKTFWDRPARRGADVYALTFTGPVDGGRMGETLLPSPPIFSFSHFLSPLFLVARRLIY